MKLYGVIGNPIGHSLSPLMHHAAFTKLGMEAHYHAFRIDEENLADAVRGFRAIELAGFNVTTPHKIAIMAHLDEIDPLAKQIGAVNTVVNRDGKLIGYNTDGLGYVRSLQELSPELTTKRILLVGAGGACRAIYFSLASIGVTQIDIANRTVEKAAALIAACQHPVVSVALTPEDVELSSYDIIIQTTTVGMYPHVAETPLHLQGIRKQTIVSDIIYNPLQTKLLHDAENADAIVQNGVDMFVYQGALAFELWTGVWPDVAHMKRIVMQKLGG